MDEDLPGRVDAGRHAHGGPPHAVELQDVLADQVVCRPPQRREPIGITPVGRHREVVDQRVVPDVEDVGVVPRNGHAPPEGRTGDGDVVEAAADEPQGLVALCVRTDEVGMALVVVEQWLFERTQAEEVVVLLHLDDRAAVHGAFAVDELVCGVVVLTRHAIEARVRAELDEAVVVDPLEELLDHGVVPRLGRANEVVVADIEPFPRLHEAGGGAVGPLQRRGVMRFGRFDDLRPVFVRAGHEKDVIAQQAVPAGQGVSVDRRVGGAHMGRVIDVVDRRSEVIGRHFGSVPAAPTTSSHPLERPSLSPLRRRTAS